MKFVVIFSVMLVTVMAQGMRKNVCPTFAEYVTIDVNPSCYHNPDVASTPDQIINRHGYPFQSFQLRTENGYYLRLMRIPRKGAPAVVLANGILLNSLSWVSIGNQSLAFVLYDAGYDVWLAEYQGSIYSPNKLESTLSNAGFWEFSFYELGYYDLPAIMEFIQNTSTSKEKIIFIGHSMGGTSGLIYASTRKDHASQHLRAMVLLAPAAFLTSKGLLINLAGSMANRIKVIANALGIYSVGYYNNKQKSEYDTLCLNSVGRLPCMLLNLWFIRNRLKDSVSAEDLPMLMSQFPTGTSLKTLLHFSQLVRTEKFQNYDYGAARNIARYGTSTPEVFNLSQINVPVYLHYGQSDSLVPGTGVVRLYNELRNTKNITEVPQFYHFDFVLSRSKAPVLRRLLLDRLSSF